MLRLTGLLTMCCLVVMSTSALGQNNAELVGSSIPSSMIPGFTYNVAVTMRNTGTTTWSDGGGYRLALSGGHAFDVYHAEARFDGSDSVAPGGQKTFYMSFFAPSAGSYSTSWRMVQDGVGFFGGTCSQVVDVAFGPSVPTAPTMISPARGAVMGSNRPDIRFQGDPCDAYEVHISRYNTPNATDGWDSGTITLNSGPNQIVAYPGSLDPQTTYYVFARLRNTNGWGPWSAYGNCFYTDGEFLNNPYTVRWAA